MGLDFLRVMPSVLGELLEEGHFRHLPFLDLVEQVR